MYHFIEVKLLKIIQVTISKTNDLFWRQCLFTYFKCHYSRFSVISGFGVILIVLGGSLGLGIEWAILLF